MKRKSAHFVQTDDSGKKNVKKHCGDNSNVHSGKHAKKIKYTKSEPPQIEASVAYYKNIFKILKSGTVDVEKDCFISNALQSSEKIEVELSCNGGSARCLKLLLKDCNNFQIVKRFMVAFASMKNVVCTDPHASFITQLLIHSAIEILKKYQVEPEEVDAEIVVFLKEWILDFGHFMRKNIRSHLHNRDFCYVFNTLIKALGGDMSRCNFMSKNNKSNDLEGNDKTKRRETVILKKSIPEFIPILKRIARCFMKFEDILGLLSSDAFTAIIMQALLGSLKKGCPKFFKKFIVEFVDFLFFDKDEAGIPTVLLDKSSSFIAEELFKTADEDIKMKLWDDYFVEHLEVLVSHPISNFVIQRLFDGIENKTHFENMCESIWSHFNAIRDSKRYSVFVSIAKACSRLESKQEDFLENIMSCLNCFEPAERQDKFIPLMLGFQKYEDSAKSSSNKIEINYHGSVLAQAVMKFSETHIIVKSMLATPPPQLAFIAGHKQGCYVLNSYFGSTSVGEKGKIKLLQHLEPIIVSMAHDKQQGFTLCRIWTLLSIKERDVLAKILTKTKLLTSSQNGLVIYNKFGLFHYEKDINYWKNLQKSILSKNM